ncbi:cysteine ABC transporter substrate-binding protein [Caballeronia arvi]|uniref:Cysteine ABC transporter substrate-binding protein n=1 Tax=Caballeronia arvi TaxID=1777135 RepID=A0A158KA59_9BURK|nr:transporter substrate-binding domain-containing protein [Caballeronia arvi]SAL77603.1 cysteine ABC transporter substrate-binding protein [Caballeronia arvi]
MRFVLQSYLAGAAACAAFLLSGHSAIAQVNSFHILKGSGVVPIANTQSNPPWNQLDDNNQPAGYDVDVAREIALRIGIGKVQFVADTLANFVDDLRTGKYDLVVNSMAATGGTDKSFGLFHPLAAMGRGRSSTCLGRAPLSRALNDIAGRTDCPHRIP